MRNSDRRTFLRNVGQGTLAAGVGMALGSPAWLSASDSEEPRSRGPIGENRIECDVLVIGGGIAASFAAIKASGQGAKVVLVDKGFVGKSGQSPFAQCFMVFNPEWGHSVDAWMDHYNKVSEYLNNRYWTEMAIRESYARYQDLLSWGVQFRRGADGKPTRFPVGPGIVEYLRFERPTVGDYAATFRQQLSKSGVKIVDRVMVAELLKQDGRIVGAIGMPLDSHDLYTFIAKATVMCVGACSFKPIGYQPLVQLTCDGEAMAYRAGGEILGKEFVDTHSTRVDFPGIIGRRTMPPEFEVRFGLGRRGEQGSGGGVPRVNAEGGELPGRPEGASQYPGTYLQYEFEAHAGRAPIYQHTPIGNVEVVGGAALGLSLRKADGLWPANTECASSLPGLYAAGDALGTMQNGAVYAVSGSSTVGSAHTGTVAGVAAAKEALRMGTPGVDEKEILRARQVVQAPAARKGGFSPRWVTQLLQNTMMPYFISYIKKEDRLQATLPIVEFIKEHLVPKLFARDPHELRLAHETKNMVLSAEMRLRSALFRTESRGNHYREDYPRRDDTNWLAWSKIREERGKMKLTKVSMPKEWWPDPATPYRQRYPFRFPGE